MKIILFLIFIMSFQAFSCDYKLEVKFSPFVVSNKTQIRAFIVQELDKMNLKETNQGREILFSIKNTKDSHSHRMYMAKSSLKIKTAGELENYTIGLGNPSRVRSDSMVFEEIKVSIMNAIAQIPACIDS